MFAQGARTGGLKQAATRLESFRKDEAGSVVVLAIFVILGMVAAMGFAVDVMRAEQMRVRAQAALDQALLAAADLDQQQDPETVVRDHLAKSGFDPNLAQVVVSPGLYSREISASLEFDVGSIFLNVATPESYSISASGAVADEAESIEIALMLDVSDAMAVDGRLDAMKAAARDFVSTVLSDPGTAERTSIVIVPFGGQVNAAPILPHMTLPQDRDYSAGYLALTPTATASPCIGFAPSAYAATSLPATGEFTRSDMFDPWSTDILRPSSVCPVSATQQIHLQSNDIATLHAHIEALQAGGGASPDIAMKWGNILLDTSFAPVVTAMVGAGQLGAGMAGRPFPQTRANAVKIAVLLSSGTVTDEPYLAAARATGLSNVWFDQTAGASIYVDRPRTAADYYRPTLRNWTLQPGGGIRAIQLDWPDVFHHYSVNYVARMLLAPTGPTTATQWMDILVDEVPATTKEGQLTAACEAARAAGTTIYTIGVGASEAGAALLGACASSSAHHFPVAETDIAGTFAAIGRHVNRLRLTN